MSNIQFPARLSTRREVAAIALMSPQSIRGLPPASVVLDKAHGKNKTSVTTLKSSFPHAPSGNPEMSTGLDSRV